MGRWEPDARGRLMQAALELYGERGFEQTTVAEIAQRAGLTERTFFRHFADKREVLFSGEVDDLVLSVLADAPPSAPPMDAIVLGLEAAGELLEERRDLVLQRQAAIAANPALRDREVIKFARLASDITDVLLRRGLEEPTARLAAEAGASILKSAFERWLEEDGDRDFGRLVRESLKELRTVTS